MWQFNDMSLLSTDILAYSNTMDPTNNAHQQHASVLDPSVPSFPQPIQPPIQPPIRPPNQEDEASAICISPPGYNACPPSMNGPSTSVNIYTPEMLQRSEELIVCTNCEDGMTAISKCNDCSEMLCETCEFAHERVKLTKDHRIRRFSNVEVDAFNLAAALPINSPVSSGIGSIHVPHNCELNRESNRLFCETCKMNACIDCVLLEHLDHHVVYMNEYYEQNRASAVKLSMDTRNASVMLRDKIMAVQQSSDNFELKMHQLMLDVRCMMKRFTNAIEDRERELLRKINNHKRSRYHFYKNQADLIKSAMNSIAVTSNLLNDALDNGMGMGRELAIINERAKLEVGALSELRPDLMTLDEGNLYFVAPDQNLLNAINTMGSINFTNVVQRNNNNNYNNYHHHNNRPHHHHNNSNHHFNNHQSNNNNNNNNNSNKPTRMSQDFRIEEGFMMGTAKGMAIFGLEFPIVVRSLRGNYPIQMFGVEGVGDGEMCRPWGVACDKKGNIVVADRSNNRIQVFTPDGKFIRKFGSYGNEPGMFDRPAGIAIDAAGRIIVADKDNHRLQIFKLDGTLVKIIGEKGGRNGQFNYPWDVAVNSEGQIVVTDTRNHRIQLFDSEGVFLTKYGFEGSSTMWKHFDSPRGVCFTPKGRILVTDFNNHRLVVIDPDFSRAQFLGNEGTGYKQFLRPQGIVCDDEGRIIIADSRNNRIQVFEENGNFLWKIGRPGIGSGEMDRPSGIALTPQGRIVTVDFGNNRVQIF